MSGVRLQTATIGIGGSGEFNELKAFGVTAAGGMLRPEEATIQAE